MYTDLTGQRFGSRTVIGRQGINSSRNALWLCRCDCGQESVTTTHSLKRTERCRFCRTNGFAAMPNGEAAFNRLLHKYKKHAQERGLVWGLTREEFRSFTKQNCYYCGCVPSLSFEARAPGTSGNNGYEDYIYNGVDRLDNNLDYTSSNCVPCCKMCNFAKRDIPHEEFEAWVLRAANHIRNR